MPPFVTDTRDRVMTQVQAALGTALAQESAAAGAQLPEEQAIALMFVIEAVESKLAGDRRATVGNAN